MPICPMCNKEVSKFKSNSHVISKWMCEFIYDEKHRAIRIESNKAPSIVQDGKKGDFICEHCEEKTSKLDSYAAKILKPQKLEEIIKTSELNGLPCIPKNHIKDFKKFQNFIFSIFLKDYFYSVKYDSKYPIAHNDGLKKHMSNILEIYNSSKIDFDSYPIFIQMVTIDELLYSSSDPNWNYSVAEPNVFGPIYKFMACGLSFIIQLSSHALSPFQDIRIQKDKDILLILMNRESAQYQLERIRKLA